MGLVAVPVSSEELEMSLALGLETGGEGDPWDVAVNVQPLIGLARTISDIIINAQYHLSLCMLSPDGV
jgi:hypothetical protein